LQVCKNLALTLSEAELPIGFEQRMGVIGLYFSKLTLLS
jgi:hypothetical protein